MCITIPKVLPSRVLSASQKSQGRPELLLTGTADSPDRVVIVHRDRCLWRSVGFLWKGMPLQKRKQQLTLHLANGKCIFIVGKYLLIIRC